MKQKQRTIWGLAFIFSIFSLCAQNPKEVSGVVMDVKGEPLIGVTVMEGNTSITNGTITDINGGFVISIKGAESTLKFRYLGYKTIEISPSDSQTKLVVMEEDALFLEEMVVVGYGKVVSRDKLTAALSKVSSDILESGSRSNPLTALSGSVTGVRVTQTSGQPGTSPNIVIRGGTTLSGTGTPLYIIDGMQRDDMNDINSNDIESLEILKDAAATAIYGARASNGVVIVSTKRGRSGKAEVSFKANVGQNFLRETFDYLNAEDFLYWSRMGAQRSMDQSEDKTTIQNLLNGATPYGTGNYYSADGNQSSSGVWSPMFLTESNEYLLGQGYRSMNDPITGKEIIYNEFSAADGSFQSAYTQDYNFSVSGGNEKSKHYSSIGYYDESGLPLDTYYKRFSLNIKSEYQLKKWLLASTGVQASKSKTKSIIRSSREDEYFAIMTSAPPVMREYNPEGELILGHNYYNGNWSGYIDNFYRRDESYRGSFNTGLKIDFSDFLSLKMQGIWYMALREKESFNKEYLVSPGVTNDDRSASASSSRMMSQTYNATFMFDKSYKNAHNINVLLGSEFFDRYNYGLAASGQGADSDDFINLQYTTPLVSDGQTQTTRNISTSHSQERILSFYTNATYDYLGKYLFSFSGRQDGYSKLVNNRWGFFPGVSGAWNIHKEDFMDDYLDVLNQVKFRASYGQNGNVNVVSGAYDLLGNYGTTSDYNGQYGTLINKLPYPNLRWEKTTSMDVALELGIYDKVRFSVDYFRKLTDDLLAYVPFPRSAGVGSQLTNNGSVRSRGVEIELTMDLIKSKDLRWTAGVNTTYLRSKIISLPDNGNINNRQGGVEIYKGASNQLEWVGGYQEGQEYGDQYSYQLKEVINDEFDLSAYSNYVDVVPSKAIYGPEAYSKLSADQKANAQQLALGDAVWEDVNGDGIIDNYDRVYQGNTVPKFLGGFTTTLSYRGFTLNARFDYAAGYSQFNTKMSTYMAMAQGTFNTVEEVKDTWTATNTSASLPAYQYADQLYKRNYTRFGGVSTFWEKANYICAREISLSYDVPKRWLAPLNITSLTVNATTQNLFYITSSSLYTPEYGANTNGGYPAPITALLGLKVTL